MDYVMPRLLFGRASAAALARSATLRTGILLSNYTLRMARRRSLARIISITEKRARARRPLV